MCDEAIEDLLRDVNMVVTRLSWPFLLPDTTVVEPPVWRTIPTDTKRDRIFQVGVWRKSSNGAELAGHAGNGDEAAGSAGEDCR